MGTRTFGLSRTDALLVLLILIWGSNFSIVKHAFSEVEPAAFNALRLGLASVTFLAAIALVQRLAHRGPDAPPWQTILRTDAPLTRGDWLKLVGLGLVGHFAYQLGFVGGLARTSVSNSALILGASPVTVTLLSGALGEDPVRRRHWIGVALSMLGLYLVVGHDVEVSREGLVGDALIGLAVLCWTVFTVGGRRMMVHHSPLAVTGLSMSIGAVPYTLYAWPALRRLDWAAVSWTTWAALVYSAMFALCLSYLIWYVAVRQLGSARTSVYSNVIPIVAMAVAYLFLGETIGTAKVLGAAAVLSGVGVARLERRRPAIPAEE
jgi:drug/metabolite transporter (DMT)-like permease